MIGIARVPRANSDPVVTTTQDEIFSVDVLAKAANLMHDTNGRVCPRVLAREVVRDMEEGPKPCTIHIHKSA